MPPSPRRCYGPASPSEEEAREEGTIHREHTVLGAGIEQLSDSLGRGGASVQEVREEALRLISALSRHRHEGADLVFEAYQVEIGGSSD